MSYRLRVPLVLFLALSIALVVFVPAESQTGSVIKLYHKSSQKFSAGDIARMASRYDLLFNVHLDQVAAIRGVNPKVLLILYELPGGRWETEEDYRTIAAKESWFVHDVRGNRLRNETKLWLLDIGNPEYRAYELDYLMKKLAASNYDGLYYDTAHPYWVPNRGWFDPSGAPARFPESVVRNWPASMLSFIQATRARLDPSKKLFWNTLALRPERAQEWSAWEQQALTIADGAQMDGFCYNRAKPYSPEIWRYQVGRIAAVAASGKIVLAKAPVERGVGSAGLEELKVFCFASYLLAADGKFAYYWPTHALGEPNFDPKLYGVALGMPTGAYREVQGTIQRDFASGRVIVNPTASAATVRIDGAYLTYTGTPLSGSVTLEPLNALILLKR